MMRLCYLSLSFNPEFASGQMDDLKFIDLSAQLELDGVGFNLRFVPVVGTGPPQKNQKEVSGAGVEHRLSGSQQ
jgi:hypothetical protein